METEKYRKEKRGGLIGRFILAKFKIMAAFIFVVNPLVAQDSIQQFTKINAWHYRVEPYLLLPNMVGSTGISPLPVAEVDATSKEIFERLKFGAMLNFEASNGTWTIGSDFLYMHLVPKVR